MGVHGGNICWEPEDRGDCGSDQSINFAGDCRLGCEFEGEFHCLFESPEVIGKDANGMISQSRLNIPDMPMGGFAAGPAAPAAAPVEEEEAAPAQQEKTLFNLKLQSFDAGAKPKIIKEIKSMLGLSLVDSKKFVESAPKLMKEGVPKEEAEKIVATLKELGGVVVME